MRKNKPKYLFQTIQFLPSPSIQPKHQTPQWNVRWIGSNPRHVHIGASLTENTTIARRSPIINQFSPRSLWPCVLNLPGVGSFSCAEDLIDRQREGEKGLARGSGPTTTASLVVSSTDITTPGIRDPVTRRVARTRGGLGARPSNSFADTRVLVPRWTPVNHVTRPRTHRTDYPYSRFPSKISTIRVKKSQGDSIGDLFERWLFWLINSKGSKWIEIEVIFELCSFKCIFVQHFNFVENLTWKFASSR